MGKQAILSAFSTTSKREITIAKGVAIGTSTALIGTFGHSRNAQNISRKAGKMFVS